MFVHVHRCVVVDVVVWTADVIAGKRVGVSDPLAFSSRRWGQSKVDSVLQTWVSVESYA